MGYMHMTKSGIYAILASLALSGAAFGADMPTKAPKAVFQPYPSTSGGYCGVGTYGEATKLNVAPPAGVTTSTFEAGGNLSAGCGYVWAISPTRKIAVEGYLNMANTGANQGGVSVSNKISGTQRLLYIGDSTMLTQWLPNLSLTDIFPAASPLPLTPLCPVGQTCNPLTLPYIGAVLRESRNDLTMGAFNERAVKVTYGVTFGLQTPMADGSVVDTWTSATSSSGAHLAGLNNGIIAHEGVTYQAGMTLKFGITKN